MCTSVNLKTDNNNHKLINFAIGTTGAIVSWESEPYLKKWIRKPFSAYIKNEFKGIQGGGYKSYVTNAVRQNNLENDIKIYDLNEKTQESVRQALKFKPTGKLTNFILKHIFRNNAEAENSFKRTLKGENAFFATRSNAIVCNFNKFGAPIFHELQHKLNSQSSNYIIKGLAKIRNPLAALGTMGVSAIAFSRDKKADGQHKNILDKIKDNCGILSALCVLPLTIEEFIANIKGTKLAEQAGVKGELLKKVKKCHKLSMYSYGLSLFATGLACWGANKIRDFICSIKKN